MDTARLLALDVVQLHGHGHAGAAMALAPLVHLLFQHVLQHDPGEPTWEGRDRFVLSAGHASLLLYIQLYLTGYGLTLDDIRATRTLGSATPGHPERGTTPGVEMTTGPLGQGVAAAVGMAASIRHLGSIAGPGSPYDQRVWCLASDGDLQEGVASEACSLAGTWGLGNLCLIWDDNGVSIDSDLAPSFTEDVRARFAAYGWRVESVDVTSDHLLETLMSVARERERPVLVALTTRIGWPIPGVAGTSSAHAGPVEAQAAMAARTQLGFDPTSSFVVEAEVLEHTRKAMERGQGLRRAWESRRREWAEQNPDRAHALDQLRAPGTGDLAGALSPGDLPVATRKVSGSVLKLLRERDPRWWGGSADLASSTATGPLGDPFSAGDPRGVDLHFGVREHAMAGIINGIALHGWFRPYGATYLVFSDYARPALRLSALMHLDVLHIYTHDSLAVGEDGPTHQPVEQLTALRGIPGVSVVRPADHAETVGVWQRLQDSPDGPACLVLSRQAVPPTPGSTARGAAMGGYVLRRAPAPDALILASGSEVHLALAAAEQVQREDGLQVQVVSMPCMEWFVDQPRGYRDSVLPPSVRARVAVEAGATGSWWRWVGLDGDVVGTDEFGASGPGPEVLTLRGINAAAVVHAVRRSVAAARGGRPLQS